MCYLLQFGANLHAHLAFGFWLLAPSVSGFWLVFNCCILEPKSLICVLFAAVWSQFACPFGFWLLALASLDSWLLVFGFCCFFFGFGFTWLLAFGRASVECMCSIVVCI